jgi:hypothetical protein
MISTDFVREAASGLSIGIRSWHIRCSLPRYEGRSSLRPDNRIFCVRLFLQAALIQLAVLIVLGCVGCATDSADHEPSSELSSASSFFDHSSNSHSDPEAVASPEIRVGDVWTDRVLGETREFKVESLTDDGDFMVDEWGNGIVTDKNWNLLTYRSVTFADAPATNWKKPLTWFKFPLFPGKTWAQNAHWETPDLNVQGTEEVRGKAIGWETVTVPAGTYKAMRVEIRDRIVGTGGTYDLVTLTYWYVPDVNRFVRYSYRDVYEGAIDAEMVSYKPAPR